MLEGYDYEEIKFKRDRLDGIARCSGTCAND